MKRREFIRNTGIAGAAVSLPGKSLNLFANGKLNVAILGSGLRGQGHIGLLLNRSDVEIVAIADPDQKMVERTLAQFDKAQLKRILV